MDAIIIRGSDLAMGGVGGVKRVKNPICVSRGVLETSPHVLLVGDGALEFAKAQGFQIVEGEALVSLRAKAMLDNVLSKRVEASTETGGSAVVATSSSSKQESGLGTVGAVAINSKGQLAAATSTGGICGKFPGRVGDTPIPGGGTYCDDRSCGLSATGLGESIMRVCLTSRIASLIDTGKDPTESCMTMFKEMTDRVGGDGGVVGITKGGDMVHAHNSKKMTWAWVRRDEVHSGCQPGEEFIDKINE